MAKERLGENGPDEAWVRAILERLWTFGSEIETFSSLTEQPALPGTITHWWQGRGWDLVRMPSGSWLGMRQGHVPEPRLLAAMSQAMGAEWQVMRAVVNDYDGFCALAGTKHANALEHRLVTMGLGKRP